jgi:ribosomal protein S18 acetylase RimI-like enzyme
VAEQGRPGVFDVRSGAVTASLRVLDWDTAFFGARMGALSTQNLASSHTSTAEALLAAAVHRAEHEAFEHFIVRFDASEWTLVRAAEAAGMRLVDIGIDLATSPRPAKAASPVRIRDAEPGDLAWAQELASAAFVHSRFWADPFFSDDAVRDFHREWVKNLWNGLAQRVFVAEAADGSPTGFNACGINDDAGRIILIGSDRYARRTGIGSALVEASLSWFAERGVPQAYVKTQVANVPALALYSRAGFIVDTTELTYSWSKRGQ